MSDITRYRWNGSAFVDISGLAPTPLLVADSFLARDGGVVAFEEHAERFTRSTEAQGMLFPSRAYIDAFADLIPREGNWFPRLDFTVRGEIESWMRPAPPLTTSVTLSTADHDPRTQPEIKGPDLTVLNSLRDDARARGADDAVILDSRGRIVDGATTCLVWWRDGALVSPPPDAVRVDSVTARVLSEMAAEQSIPLAVEAIEPAQLDGLTAWAINALHGIREVTAWLDGPTLEPNPELTAQWRAAYELRRAPLPR